MTAFHVMAGASGEFARPEVRKIGIPDIVDYSVCIPGLIDSRDARCCVSTVAPLL